MATESELIAQAIANGTDLPGRTGQADYQHTYYEADGQPYYKKVGGGKMYIPPVSAMSMFNDPTALAWAKKQGYEIKGGQQGLDDASRGVVGPDGKTRYPDSPVTTASQSGGLFHTTGTWNSESGKFDSGIDWSNVFTMVVAGLMTAGAATALMASAGVPTAVANASVSAAVTEGSAEAGLTTLAGSSIVPTLGTLPSVAASGTIGALEGGAVAGATGAAVTGAEAGVLPSTTIAPELGALPSVASSGATTAIDALPSTVLAPTTGALPNVASSGATTAIDTLPSSTIAPTMGTLPNVTPSGAIPATLTGAPATSLLDKIKTGKNIADTSGEIGAEISGATKAAGQAQLANAQVGVAANNSNISAQKVFEDALIARAKLEAGQRNSALADVYRNNVTLNPSRSPFNPVAAKPQSADYLSTLASLAAQGQTTLAKPAQYAPGSMPAQTPYTPYKPDTDPSTMQTIGNYAGPALSTIGALYKLYG